MGTLVLSTIWKDSRSHQKSLRQKKSLSKIRVDHKMFHPKRKQIIFFNSPEVSPNFHDDCALKKGRTRTFKVHLTTKWLPSKSQDSNVAACCASFTECLARHTNEQFIRVVYFVVVHFEEDHVFLTNALMTWFCSGMLWRAAQMWIIFLKSFTPRQKLCENFKVLFIEIQNFITSHEFLIHSEAIVFYVQFYNIIWIFFPHKILNSICDFNAKFWSSCKINASAPF